MSSTSSTSSSYYSVYAADPATTAKTFADEYTANATAQIKSDTSAATSTATALTSLESALSAFQLSLAGLNSVNTAVLAHSATFSDTTYGTASAKAAAVPASYSFFVQTIATAGQISYGGLTSTTAAGSGSLQINQPGLGTSFSVDLSSADKDGDLALSPQEIAAAINSASGNAGSVTASVVTINGKAQLSLLSAKTGANSDVSIDASNVTNATLQGELTNSANIVQGPVPKDAVIWLGDENTGTQITQASNTFTNIDGVSMTFTKAMATGTPPITLTVATDTSTTAANLKTFVAAYNTLKGVLTPMLDLGDPTSAANTPGVFSTDAGVRALSSTLVSLLTKSIGGVSLANYGITNQLDGTLSLNTTTLNKALVANPSGLNDLMGSSTGVGSGTGLLGSVDKFVETWSDSSNGYVTQRQADVAATQKKLAQQQTNLDTTYNDVYARYLTQFTQLQTTETQMHTNTDLFDALFGSGSSS